MCPQKANTSRCRCTETQQEPVLPAMHSLNEGQPKPETIGVGTIFASAHRRHVTFCTVGLLGLIDVCFPFNPPFPTIGEEPCAEPLLPSRPATGLSDHLSPFPAHSSPFPCLCWLCCMLKTARFAACAGMCPNGEQASLIAITIAHRWTGCHAAGIDGVTEADRLKLKQTGSSNSANRPGSPAWKQTRTQIGLACMQHALPSRHLHTAVMRRVEGDMGV